MAEGKWKEIYDKGNYYLYGRIVKFHIPKPNVDDRFWNILKV